MSSPDLRQLEKQLLKRTKIERRSGPKPVRLSNLIAQTAWLDGQLLWCDGRVVFQVGEKMLRIEDEEIRRTSRALDRLEQRDLRRELVDLIVNRRRKFGYLREIATIEALDLKTLCSVSRRQNPKAIERLGALLIAESLLPEIMEHSPTRALAQAWPLSQPILESLAKSEIYPSQTHDLARFALANRHFEFWQKNVEFPVVLCRKLGLAGHEIPALFEKKGPYSLSHAQIYGLFNEENSPARILEVVDELREIPSVWLNSTVLRLPLPIRKSDISDIIELRSRYKSFEKDSLTSVSETLFLLAKRESGAAFAAVKFLVVWQEIWHESFSTTPKRRRVPEAELAQEVFESAFSVVRRLETYEHARDVLEFALEKSLEVKNDYSATRLDQSRFCHYLSNEISQFCDVASSLGVEKVRQLDKRDFSNLHLLSSQPEWMKLALHWVNLCEGETDFLWELSQAQRKGNSLSIIRDFGRDMEKELRLFTPQNRDLVFDYALENKWSRPYAQLLTELYRRLAVKISNFHVDHHKVWACILSTFALVSDRNKWSLETSLQVFEVVFECLKGRFNWAREQECTFDAMRSMQYVTGLFELRNARDLENYRAVLGQTIEWARTSSGSDMLWNLDQEVAFTVSNRKNLRRAFFSIARCAPRFAFETIPQMTSLKRLHLMEVFDGFESRILLRGEQWHRFLARYPSLQSELLDCFKWGKLAGEDCKAPPISNRWRDYETKTPREMEFLRAKIVEQPQNLGLQKRLATLETQWQTRDVWLPDELRECLRDAASNSAKVAIQNAISSALRARLRVVCGELPLGLELDNDWINAILLACEVEENRKWAVAILRNCARVLLEPEAADWREKLEGNAKFLGEMRERGKNLDIYAARNERQIGDYTLWIESEPLQILQMGNRFDTCLSRGGINEHSAITNAIDANKKVVYARQHSNIVGRQLLCVSENFELLGYNVYSTFQSESKEKYTLNRAFYEYASSFAKSVGLEKADKGNVLALCGASWYDDYEIDWTSLLEEPPIEKSASKSRSVKSDSTRLGTKSTQKRRKITNSLRHTRGNDSSNSGVGFPALASS